MTAASNAPLAAAPQTHFADHAKWLAHLGRLGLTTPKVTLNPVQIATEGATWGNVRAHDFLCDAISLSDDAGQFDISLHALCWGHAERAGERDALVAPPD